MADGFYGEVRAFAFNFVPQNWAECNGSWVYVQQNQILAAILGSLYGPFDGQRFYLPDLRGYAVTGAGNPSAAVVASGMPTSIPIGAKLGTPAVTLTSGNIPAHQHTITGVQNVRTSMESVPGPTNSVSRPIGAPTGSLVNGVIYPAWAKSESPDSLMSPGMIAASGGTPTGGVNSHENRQPYLTLLFCICIDGMWPARP